MTDEKKPKRNIIYVNITATILIVIILLGTVIFKQLPSKIGLTCSLLYLLVVIWCNFSLIKQRIKGEK
jgi:amino acid transporter